MGWKYYLCTLILGFQRKNPHKNRTFRRFPPDLHVRVFFIAVLLFFIAERLLRLPKSSESFELREGYIIFEDFKNDIKNYDKTWYIKSSISIESSFHVECNELGFNSVPPRVGSKNEIFGS